jgi:hypothetical protein
VHQLERTPQVTKQRDDTVDLVQGRHPGRNEGLLALLGDEPQQRPVAEHRGRDLVVRQIELPQEQLAVRIPRRREPGDTQLAAVRVDARVLVAGELEPFLLMPLRGPPRALAGTVEELGRIDLVHRPLLELHRIEAGVVGGSDQALGDPQIAVVIDPDFSNEKQSHLALRFLRYDDH